MDRSLNKRHKNVRHFALDLILTKFDQINQNDANTYKDQHLDINHQNARYQVFNTKVVRSTIQHKKDMIRYIQRKTDMITYSTYQVIKLYSDYPQEQNKIYSSN